MDDPLHNVVLNSAPRDRAIFEELIALITEGGWKWLEDVGSSKVWLGQPLGDMPQAGCRGRLRGQSTPSEQFRGHLTRCPPSFYRFLGLVLLSEPICCSAEVLSGCCIQSDNGEHHVSLHFSGKVILQDTAACRFSAAWTDRDCLVEQMR